MDETLRHLRNAVNTFESHAATDGDNCDYWATYDTLRDSVTYWALQWGNGPE